jgi:hypothetical protein
MLIRPLLQIDALADDEAFETDSLLSSIEAGYSAAFISVAMPESWRRDSSFVAPIAREIAFAVSRTIAPSRA